MHPLILEAMNEELQICKAVNEELFSPRDYELMADAMPKIRNYKANANRNLL